MKIRFKTRDNLTMVKECPDIDEPVSTVHSPLFTWKDGPAPGSKYPKDFLKYRRYEFRGEVEDGIPTVHEA